MPMYVMEDFAIKCAKIQICHEPGICARRATRGRKEGGECFAPLCRYFLLRSCAPKRVEMMPGRPQVNTKIGKSLISRPLVNDYFELVLQVLPSTLKFNATPVKLTAPTKMPNNLV